MLKHFIILFFAFLSCSTNAQFLSSKHYTVTDDLPSNICYRIFQDKRGFILVATEKGIASFDGYSFKPYQIRGKFSSKDIWGMIQDNRGRIWLRTKQFKNEYIYNDSIYTIQDQNSTFKVITLFANEPLIYKTDSTDNSIYLLDSLQHLNPISISKNFKKLIIEYQNQIGYFNFSNHTIYFSNYNGEWIEYNLDSKEINLRKYSTPFKPIGSSKASSEFNSLYFIFSAGDTIYKHGPSGLKYITTYTEAGLNNESVIVGMIQQEYYGILNGKLFMLDSNFKPIQKLLPDIRSRISQVYEDNEHNRWFNTIGDGLYFVSNKMLNNSIYNKESGLLHNHILSIDKREQGDIILGNYLESSFQRLKNGVLESIPKNYSQASSMLWFKDGDYMIAGDYISQVDCKFNYLGQDYKIIEARKGKYKIYHFDFSVKSLCKQDERTFYIGNGSILMKATKLDHSIKIERLGITKGDIYSICIRGNQILLGTAVGMYQYDGKSIRSLQALNSTFNSYIRDIKIDRYKNTWVCNDLNNLECYDSTFKLLSKFPELTDGLATKVYIDSMMNEVYACTSAGLFRIKTNHDKNFKYSILKFTVANGLASNEVNDVVADSSLLYVATSSGLSILSRKFVSTATIPPIYCTRLSINGIEQPLKSKYSLSYNQQSIQIELTALSYQSLGNIQYAYRLNESETQWTITNQRTIEFSSLKPGHYQFEAKAKDIDGTESMHHVIIEFNITPPFWKTWWFYLVALSVLMTLLIIYFYNRFKISKRKEVQEAKLKMDMAELKLNALQSQLNSHFIYNSLNAIQNFIFSNDEVAASEYMNKFARLIRLFLESSRNKLRAIHYEIELITLYTSLEELRFRNKFDVDIKVGKRVNPESMFPTNIVQPFVENSIIHGFLSKETKGHLRIEFDEDDSQLICIIDDDGIGREKSDELNTKRKRNSLGMQLINDKILNMSSIFGNHIQIEIIDKDLVTHSTTGTIVKIIYKK